MIGSGREHLFAMHLNFGSQQSASTVHFSNSCTQTVPGGLSWQTSAPPSPALRQKPLQHSSPVSNAAPAP